MNGTQKRRKEWISKDVLFPGRQYPKVLCLSNERHHPDVSLLHKARVDLQASFAF